MKISQVIDAIPYITFHRPGNGPEGLVWLRNTHPEESVYSVLAAQEDLNHYALQLNQEAYERKVPRCKLSKLIPALECVVREADAKWLG